MSIFCLAINATEGCEVNNGGCEEKCNEISNGLGHFCTCPLPGKVRSTTVHGGCEGMSDTDRSGMTSSGQNDDILSNVHCVHSAVLMLTSGNHPLLW